VASGDHDRGQRARARHAALKTLGGDDTVTVDPGVSALIIPVVDLGADE